MEKGLLEQPPGASLGRWLARLRLWGARAARPEGILSATEFNQCLQKEQSRCARNAGHYCFSVVRVRLRPGGKPLNHFRLAADIRDMVRMVDEVALGNGEIAVLLPETDRNGAIVVASRIQPLAVPLDLAVNISILAYPEDDPVASQGSDAAADGQVERTAASRLDPPHNQPGSAFQRASAAAGSVEIAGSGFGQAATAVLAEPAPEPVVAGARAIDLPGIEVRPGTETPFLTLATPLWKSAIDLCCSTAGLVLTSPLFAAAALAIKLDSPGPVFYRQKREGKDGRVFEILKFRTMRQGAESERDQLLNRNEQDGPAFKVTNDPRVTRVGWYLRKSCIDELPQLINVLRGDMSLVGPRPLPVAESRGSQMWHRRRLTVLPGLTCLWQVAGNRKMKFDDWMRLDLEYVRRRRLTLDLWLMCRTALLALLHRGNV